MTDVKPDEAKPEDAKAPVKGEPPVVRTPRVIADEPVPKLPRGRGMRFSGPQLVRIAMTLVTLIGVIVLTKPCSESVSNFVMGYEGKEKKLPKHGTVDVPNVPSDLPKDPQQYETLKAGMTDEEIKAAIERSKARNAAANAGSGSASGSGSATGSGSASVGSAHQGSGTVNEGSGRAIAPRP